MVSAWRRLMRFTGSLILGFASLLLVAGAGAAGSSVPEVAVGTNPANVALGSANSSKAEADPGPELQRFVGQPDYSFHWATTDPSEIPAAFLPDILEDTWNLTSGGADQVPLYDCQQSGQPGNYISTTADCSDGLLDGHSVTQNSGLEGYLYMTPPTDGTGEGTATEAVYRCYHVIEGAPDYFLSPYSDCEGSGVATLLGYAPDDAQSTSIPGAPMIGTATGGNAEATVTFGPPADDGGGVASYTVTATDTTNSASGGQSATGSGSPISVSGLANGDSYMFSVTATNAAGTGPPSGTSNTVQVGQAPAITSANSLTAAAGAAFTYSVTTTGAPLSTITVASDSSLPNGVTLKDNADGTATLSGTDQVAMGDYTFSIQAANGISPNATQPFTLTVQNLPTTSILVPSKDATLSGTSVTLDASASNATSVEFLLFGGIYGLKPAVICTATLTYYGWLCSWNTTTIPNGSYTLVSYASGPSGSTASLGVNMKVSNPPPTTSVLIPSSGSTLSGSTYLDASASNATTVQFLLFGGTYGYSAPVVCTATATQFGWICGWNTTTVQNGSYVLVSEASGAGGSAFSSRGVSITVKN
jgi:Bacterial Ig domain/Fibronectin type III domain